MNIAIVTFFWLATGSAVFFLALRGGPAGVGEMLLAQGPAGRRAVLSLLIVVALGAGVAAPAYVIASNDDNAAVAPSGTELTASEARGRELFGLRCSSCHILAASRAVGRVGPNLDELRPPAELVRDAVVNGRARGIGRMPAGLYLDEEADDVAAYVERVAGR